jgi:ABC-type Fe3+ transport system substrate-binding protein
MPQSDKLTVTINDEERELFMSFGLLDELTRIVKDPARIGSINLDPDLRQEFLTATFAKRKKSGKIEEPTDFDDLDVSIEDIEKTISWAQEHVLNFFVRSFRNIQKVTEQYQTEITDLTSSLAGSKGSASKKQSS